MFNKKRKEEKAKETKVQENVMQELDDAELDQVSGAGDPFANRPRVSNQQIDKSLRKKA